MAISKVSQDLVNFLLFSAISTVLFYFLGFERGTAILLIFFFLVSFFLWTPTRDIFARWIVLSFLVWASKEIFFLSFKNAEVPTLFFCGFLIEGPIFWKGCFERYETGNRFDDSEVSNSIGIWINQKQTFLYLKLLFVWLFVFLLYIFSIQIFGQDKASIGTYYKSIFIIVGLGLVTLKSFLIKIEITIRLIFENFEKDNSALEWIKMRAKNYEASKSPESIDPLSEAEKLNIWVRTTRRIFSQKLHSTFVLLLRLALPILFLVSAISASYLLAWHEALIFCALYFLLPYLIGLRLPSIHSSYWTSFLQEVLKGKRRLLEDSEKNSGPIEALDFFIERIEIYKIFIQAPALNAGLGGGGREVYW